MSKIGKYTAKITLIFVLMAIVACSDTDSSNVRSEGIHADFDVVATGNGRTKIEADLEVGSGLASTDLRLSGGDRLTVTANGQEIEFERDSGLFGNIVYEASFNFDDGGTEFVISLSRPNDTDAPDSRVTLPQDLEFLTPEEDEVFELGEEVTVSWQQVVSTDTISIDFRTSCPTPSGGEQVEFNAFTRDDSGVFTISVAALLGNADRDIAVGVNCTTEIELSRRNVGQIDPNYGEGGRITADQIRTRDIIIDR